MADLQRQCWWREIEAVRASGKRQSGPEIQSLIIRTKYPGLEGWEDLNGGLYYQDLPYVPEIIRAKLISRPHIDVLTCDLELKRPVHLPSILLAIIATYRSLQQSVQAYIKGCNVCFLSIVRAQALWQSPIVAVAALPTRQEKDCAIQTSYGYDRCPRLRGSHP